MYLSGKQIRLANIFIYKNIRQSLSKKANEKSNLKNNKVITTQHTKLFGQ
jgi:hypothetical protein